MGKWNTQKKIGRLLVKWTHALGVRIGSIIITINKGGGEENTMNACIRSRQDSSSLVC